MSGVILTDLSLHCQVPYFPVYLYARKIFIRSQILYFHLNILHDRCFNILTNTPKLCSKRHLIVLESVWSFSLHFKIYKTALEQCLHRAIYAPQLRLDLFVYSPQYLVNYEVFQSGFWEQTLLLILCALGIDISAFWK